MIMKMIIAFILLFTPAVISLAAEGVKFVGELPAPGEYSLFAGGGWDGNWYVGYTQKWVAVLPPVDTQGYERAFAGACLGRAKTLGQMREVIKIMAEEEELSVPELPERPGRIKIGVSNSIDNIPSGSLLAATDEIPLEGSPVEAWRDVGGSRWFFTEIDINDISSAAENLVFLFSNDRFLDTTAVAPILAAGIGSGEDENTYIIKDNGEKSVIRYFKPAIAIKLVEADSPEPFIEISEFKRHPHIAAAHSVITDVRGENITRVWLEIDDGSGWRKTGHPQQNPPYDLIFENSHLNPGNYKIRAAAGNWWENVSYSQEIELTID